MRKYFENLIDRLVQWAKDMEQDVLQDCLDDIPDNQSDDPYTINMIKSIYQENTRARYI